MAIHKVRTLRWSEGGVNLKAYTYCLKRYFLLPKSVHGVVRKVVHFSVPTLRMTPMDAFKMKKSQTETNGIGDLIICLVVTNRDFYGMLKQMNFPHICIFLVLFGDSHLVMYVVVYLRMFERMSTYVSIFM